MTRKTPPTEKSGPDASRAGTEPFSDSAPNAPSNGSGSVDRVVQLYGDLVFDLCESVLWSPVNAQLAFRSIIKTIRKQRKGHGFTEHERSWVLQIACDKLLELSSRHGRKLTSVEQIQLNAAQGVSSRLKEFDSYFHRLMTDDQILLLLRDKYGIPYPEIASALGLPEGTLKIRRSQALRSLEEWLWEQR